MLHTAVVPVYRHPVFQGFGTCQCIFIGGVRVTQEIPGRTCPLGHGIGFSLSGASAAGTGGVYPVRHVRQRGLAVVGGHIAFHIGKLQRKLAFRQRHIAALPYYNNRLQLGIFEKEIWLQRALDGKKIVFSRNIASKYTTLTYGYDVARQYKLYKLAAGKTAKSILISCGARLSPFDIQEIRDATMYDELELDKLGDRKTALFLIMSDTDSTFNFLISMIYSQLFNLLCDKADDVYGGKLPVHVRCLIDECANIGQIPQLEKLVATIRSREISACLVLQTRSQLKAIYKDNADTIVGNMDSQIFLGGSEPTTLKDLAEALGKETIDSYNNSDTRGNSPSYGTNYQKLGHELMSRDELAVLDGGKCILQLRGVRPFLSDKYDLTQHPNYKLTSDANPKNALDIEKYLSHKEKIHSDDQFVLVDVDSLPPA